jgi:hypothetical protein
MKKIITSAVAVALSAAGLVPFAAFADTGASVSAGASVESQSGTSSGMGELVHQGGGMRRGGTDASTTLHMYGSTHNSSTTEDRMQNHAGNMQARIQGGDNEIAHRIDSLNKILGRIEGTSKLTGDEKASFTTSINASIASLASLNLKLASDTDSATIKADKDSITKAYRVYALVLPQTAIAVAVDRQVALIGQMQTLSTKLSARIDALKATGVDTTAQVSALADFNAKVAAAQVSVQAASSSIAGLKPDNGDTTVAASNKAALTSAHQSLLSATASLKAARLDVKIIAKATKGTNDKKDTKDTQSTSTSNS